ncbi:MAG: hypothetical protein RIF41_18055 [Polyangiaceae bacterium]
MRRRRRTLRSSSLAFAAWLTAVAACSFPDVDIDPNAQCERDAECGSLGHCVDLRCVACVTDDHCAETSPGSRCSPSGECVACLSEADCPSGVCDASSGSCLECATDADCDGQRCDEGVCVECLSDDDCPGRCSARRCVECVEDSHCDPPHCLDEQCVACVVESDCEPSFTCDEELHVCKHGHCSDKMPHPNETDDDCGGVCPPCGVDGVCVDGDDCASGICVDQVCQPCQDSTNCPPDAYCDGRVCAPRRPLGASCADISDSCVVGAECSQGVCCETACDGTCEGCSEFITGQPSGQCAQALPGTPCTTLMLVSGKCTAAGTCFL